MNQVERCISSNSIMSGVDRISQSLCVFVPVLLIFFHDIHLDRSIQRLHHAFGRTISLRSIRHGGPLVLSRDQIECSEEIRHKSRLAIMAYRLTRTESSEHALLVILCDRLGRSGRACLCDHTSREQIDPQQQIGVSFKGSWQRRDVIHSYNLKRVRRLHITR